MEKEKDKLTIDDIISQCYDLEIDDCDVDYPILGIREDIKEYARQKCQEQKEICAKQEDYYGTGNDGTSCIYEHLIEEQILNAPEPKFD